MNRLFGHMIVVFASVLLPLAAIANFTGLERQHGAHVHGQATGTLALDSGRLSLSLVVPGMNLVGFEHAPNDDAQRERLQAVKQALASGAWLEVDPDGDCRLDRVELATRGFGEDRDHPHGHAHHEHDHEGRDAPAVDDHHHEHAEFQFDVSIECTRPEDLAWIDLGLFDNYPGNVEMRIDVLTETRAERVRLTANDSRIHLSQ